MMQLRQTVKEINVLCMMKEKKREGGLRSSLSGETGDLLNDKIMQIKEVRGDFSIIIGGHKNQVRHKLMHARGHYSNGYRGSAADQLRTIK